MKKRKLNSKNPKYMKKAEAAKVIKRVAGQGAGKYKVFAVYLEK